MNNLSSITEFIQKLSLEAVEINIILKEIDEKNQENSGLEIKLEELDREYIRLQIELYNLETVISHNDVSSLENFHQTSIKMFKDSVDLHNLIEKIDFAKILQCYHMEMEAKCRNEWKPIHDGFLKTLKWHKEMEQRHIVQKYYQAEIECKQAKEANINQKEIIKKSLKQSLELILQAEERRNELIILLIKGNKNLNEYTGKMKKLNQYRIYIQDLRQENLKLRNQLEKSYLKAFNPMLSLRTNNNSTDTFESNTENTNIMPKLPSFTDILKSFNQIENITNVTAIENINFCVKSILHTSNLKQSITTKQTKNVRFKVQLEEYQEEITQNFYNNEFESETDIEIEVLPTQEAMEISYYQDEKENVEEAINEIANNADIEVVDLLTPIQNPAETVKTTENVMDISNYDSNIKKQIDKKPLIEIQDCIIFKTPFPIREVKSIEDKENVSNSTMTKSSKQPDDTYSSNSSHLENNNTLNTSKKTFYEEFLNDSPFTEASPVMEGLNSNNNESSVLKNFEAMFGNKDFLLVYKELNEDTINNTESNKITTTTTEVQEFEDFGPDQGFNFDSDDMTDSRNAGNMDFM